VQNQEIQQSETRKPSLNWKTECVIFLVLPTVVIFLVSFGGLFYLCGRFSPHLVHFMVCPVYPVSGIFIIYCFIAGMVRLSRAGRKANRRKRALLLGEIGIPLVSIALFVTSLFLPDDSDMRWPPFKSFAYGFRDRIRSKGGIESIRDLLKTFRKPDEREITPRIPYQEWPKSLKALRPKIVVLCEDKNGTGYIMARWGGGFLPWGLIIGMQNIDIPPSSLEYRLLLEPGVYIWVGL